MKVFFFSSVAATAIIYFATLGTGAPLESAKLSSSGIPILGVFSPTSVRTLKYNIYSVLASPNPTPAPTPTRAICHCPLNDGSKPPCTCGVSANPPTKPKPLPFPPFRCGIVCVEGTVPVPPCGCRRQTLPYNN